jgi:hypothetical protein
MAKCHIQADADEPARRAFFELMLAGQIQSLQVFGGFHAMQHIITIIVIRPFDSSIGGPMVSQSCID